MNNLSWMIYAADVLGNLRNLFTACAIMSGLAVCAISLAYAIGQADGDVEEGSWKKPLRLLPLVFVFALMAVLSPSSSTIYMIAASEAGETVVTSPEAKEIFSDLKSVIKSKLKEELGEDK